MKIFIKTNSIYIVGIKDYDIECNIALIIFITILL